MHRRSKPRGRQENLSESAFYKVYSGETSRPHHSLMHYFQIPGHAERICVGVGQHDYPTAEEFRNRLRGLRIVRIGSQPVVHGASGGGRGFLSEGPKSETAGTDVPAAHPRIFSGAGRVPNRLIQARSGAGAAHSDRSWTPSLAQSTWRKTPDILRCRKVSRPPRCVIENGVTPCLNQLNHRSRMTFFYPGAPAGPWALQRRGR